MSAREIRTQAVGSHWIAWFADAEGKPSGGVTIVGASQDEASANARTWASQQAASA